MSGRVCLVWSGWVWLGLVGSGSGLVWVWLGLVRVWVWVGLALSGSVSGYREDEPGLRGPSDQGKTTTQREGGREPQGHLRLSDDRRSPLHLAVWAALKAA